MKHLRIMLRLFPQPHLFLLNLDFEFGRGYRGRCSVASQLHGSRQGCSGCGHSLSAVAQLFALFSEDARSVGVAQLTGTGDDMFQQPIGRGAQEFRARLHDAGGFSPRLGVDEFPQVLSQVTRPSSRCRRILGFGPGSAEPPGPPVVYPPYSLPPLRTSAQPAPAIGYHPSRRPDRRWPSRPVTFFEKVQALSLGDSHFSVRRAMAAACCACPASATFYWIDSSPCCRARGRSSRGHSQPPLHYPAAVLMPSLAASVARQPV